MADTPLKPLRWFTSDHHFGHVNIIDYVPRPFRTVTHMNEALVANWNDHVGPDDDVYVVGDFAMGQIDHTIHYAERLNGNKYLIPGNHDRCWKGHAKADQWLPVYEQVGFTVLDSSHLIEIGGTPVLLCHFPYRGDNPGKSDRFTGNRPDDQGGWLMHGHTHAPQRVVDRMIHVGVDAWHYMPVRETWIQRIINGNASDST